MVSLQLCVVDRLTEVERLVRTAEFNSHLPDIEKPVLLYSSQVFGSGKSTFGISALSLMKDTAVTQALLHPPSETDVPQDLIDMRKSMTFTQELVDSYSNARTIFVDLGRGLAKSPSIAEKRVTFQEALYHAIYCAAIKSTDIPSKQFLSELGDVNSDSLMRLLVEKTGHKGKWLFFIDEIGKIDHMANDYEDIKNPTPYINSKPQHINGYTLLFDILCPFLRRNDTFAFCAGKSASLTEKSLEESGSPVRLRLLAMSPLQPQHIVDVMRKTKHKGRTLQEALGVHDDMLLRFAEIVYRYTGGIPRLVCRAFESLLGVDTPILDNTDAIEMVMNGKVRDDIVTDTSCFFRPDLMSADATRVYTTLLLMSVLHIKIKKTWVMRIGPAGGTKFALDWISNLCLHIAPHGPDTYVVVFSQYLIDYLQRYPPNGERRIVLLASLLEQLRSLPPFLDQGRILEVMFAQSLAYHLAFATTFGDIPGLQDTLLGGVVVPRDIGRGFGIQFLPSFQKKTTKGIPSIDHGVTKSYNPADWHMFFLDLVTRDYMNVVGIAREKNSNGPDLMLPIQATALADRAQLPTNFYFLGFAMKNLQAEGATNWADIKDEIDKGLKEPLKNNELNGKLRVVLVIASTNLMKEIEDVIGPKLCHVYHTGTWYYNKTQHKLEVKGKPLKDWEEKFTVPKHGELVILTKSGMTKLLGDHALTALSNYFSRSEDEQCNNLLLLESSIALAQQEGNVSDAQVTHTTTEHKRKHKDDNASDALVTHTTTEHKRKRKDNNTSDPLVHNIRTFKVIFVENGSRNEIGSPAMAVVPPGTTLNDSKNIISSVFSARNPSRQGHVVVGIEWEGVLIERDEDLDGVQHRDKVVVLIQ